MSQGLILSMKQSLWTNELDSAKKTRVYHILHIFPRNQEISHFRYACNCRENKGNMYDEGRCGGNLKINSLLPYHSTAIHTGSN